MGIRRGLVRLGALSALIYAGTFAYVLGFAATFENPATTPQADMIICLGGGAREDGSLAASSTGRALACADLYTQGAAPVILFTGANRDKTVQSVARAMADVAQKQGVPQSAIVLEEGSRSTLQNALFSKPLIRDAETIILVTQGFHLPRSKVSFQAFGPWTSTLWMSEPFDQHPDNSIKWQTLHRETLAIWFNLIRYGIWRFVRVLGYEKIDSWLA